MALPPSSAKHPTLVCFCFVPLCFALPDPQGGLREYGDQVCFLPLHSPVSQSPNAAMLQASLYLSPNLRMWGKKLKTDNMLTDPRLKLDQQPYLPNTPAACQLLSMDFPSEN